MENRSSIKIVVLSTLVALALFTPLGILTTDFGITGLQILQIQSHVPLELASFTVDSGITPYAIDIATAGTSIYVAESITPSEVRVRKSTNGGSSWSTVYSDTDATQIRISATDADTVFITYADTGAGSLVLRGTTNGGSSWTGPFTLTTDYSAQYLRLDAVSSTTAFVAHTRGSNTIVHRTTNGGSSFTNGTISGASPVWSIDALDATNVFVGYYRNGTGNGYLGTSANGGFDWSEDIIQTGGTLGGPVTAVSTSTLWAAYYSTVVVGNGTESHLRYARTTNGGSAWTRATIDGSDDFNDVLSIDAFDADNVIIGYGGQNVAGSPVKYIRSYNAGTTWFNRTLDTVTYPQLGGPSVAMTSDDKIHVAYYDNPGSSTHYVTSIPDECATLTQSKTLDHNVIGTDGCFIIGADDLTLDCQGYTVTYATTGPGVALSASGRDNITIQNCHFIDGGQSTGAINFSSVTSSTIRDTILDAGSAPGVRLLSNSDSNTLQNTTLETNGTWILTDGTSNSNTFDGRLQSNRGSIRFPSVSNIPTSETLDQSDAALTLARAYLNSSSATWLNQSANITFTGLASNGDLLVDLEDDGTFIACSPPRCVNKQYSSGTMTFDVSGFTTYIANQAPVISSVSISTPTGFNQSNENITATIVGSDVNGDARTNYTLWQVDGQSIYEVLLRFEGGSNATYTKDYSSNNHSATLVSMSYSDSLGIDGNGAYTFDGSSSYIDIGNIGLSGNLTVMMWIRPDAQNDRRVFSQRSGSAGQGGSWRLSSGNLEVWSGGAWQAVISGGIQTGAWQHVAVTYLGGTVTGYLNGSAQSSGTSNFDFTTANLGIGDRFIGGFGSRYDGIIDEFIIVNRALNENQIRAFFEQQYEVIAAGEASAGEVWQACVTPNDGIVDGAQVCSNEIEILAPLHITKTAPTNLIIENTTLIDYTLLVRAYQNFTNVNVTDTPFSALQFVNSTPAPDIGNHTWFIGNLSAGQTYTINLTLNLTEFVRNGTNLTNVATVAGINSSGQQETLSDTVTTVAITPYCYLISSDSITGEFECNSIIIGAGQTVNVTNATLIAPEAFIVQQGATLSGYAAGPTGGTGAGSSCGFGRVSGGSHGGLGAGPCTIAATYGSAMLPRQEGSGMPGQGTNGGTLIEIQTTAFENYGTITVDGEDRSGAAGGAGGSILLNASTIIGNGTFSARGGDNTDSAPIIGDGSGPGGGGRIALYYDNATLESMTFNVQGGVRLGDYVAGDGTVVFIDRDDRTLRSGSEFRFETTDWPGGIVNYTTVNFTNSQIDVDRSLHFYATHVTMSNISVTSDETLINYTFDITNLTIASNALLSAEGNGYATAQGPGAGFNCNFGRTTGGSHAGHGAGPCTIPDYYGSAINPVAYGSGGNSGDGGGVVIIRANHVHIDGNITVAGATTPSGSAGAGGSIFINASNVEGNGRLDASGGNVQDNSPIIGDGGGPGGGGRITILADTWSINASQLDISGGVRVSDYTAGRGTIAFIDRDDNELAVYDTFRFETTDWPNQTVNYEAVTFENVEAELDSNLTFNTGSITLTNSTIFSDDTLIWLRMYATTINVSNDSIITLQGNGYTNAQGPGAGANCNNGRTSGGSHGGRGAGPCTIADTYGSAMNPTIPGSAGPGTASKGGGALIIVGSTLHNDGVITAAGASQSGAAGGSGGFIFINATTLTGTGRFVAAGGNNPDGSPNIGDGPGPGGGGRIAIYTSGVNINLTQLNVSGGIRPGDYTAGDGTSMIVDTSSDTLYAGDGFRTEDTDAQNGLLNISSLVSERVTLQIGTNRTLHLQNSFTVVHGQITTGVNALRVATNTINLTNTSVTGNTVDLEYESFDDDNATYSSSIALRLARTNIATVNWTSTVSNPTALSRNVILSENLVRVNSTAVPGLNTSARITLYTGFSDQPVPKWDPEDDGSFVDCPPSVCTSVSFNNVTGAFTFDVTHFTGFSSGFNSELTIFDSADPQGGSILIYPGATAEFFANYTNSTSGVYIQGTCLINITGVVSNANMTFNNSGTELYEYNAIMPSAANVTWSVSCTNNAGFTNLTATDYIFVNTPIAPVPEFADFALMLVVGLVLGGFVLVRRRL